MTPIELRQRAADLEGQALALMESVAEENRDLSEVERSSYDGWLAEADRYETRATELDAITARVQARRGTAGRVSAPIAGEQEADRRGGLGDFLRNVGIMGDSKANRREQEAANDLLTNKYRSRYSSWTDESRPRETRAMASTSGTLGGYTMPTDLYKGIMSVATPQSIVRRRAKVIPMSTLEIDIPMLDQTTAQSAGVPPYFGGLTAAWTGEAASIG